MKIKTLLIANRGEVACRIARTARAWGVRPVAVHSAADVDALHVREIGHSICIGDGPASESYLRIDAVLAAAKAAGADAVHPGYGFLAENPEFARGLGGDAMEAGQRVMLTDAAGSLEELCVGPVRSGDTFRVCGSDGAALTFSCREIAPGQWRVAQGETVDVATARLHGGVIEIDAWPGRLVFRPAPPLALALAAGDSAAERKVTSPLTGMIVDVKVSEGDAVAEGDVVAVLESMKLEISIKASASGIAANIAASKGMMVDRGQIIAEIIAPEKERA